MLMRQKEKGKPPDGRDCRNAPKKQISNSTDKKDGKEECVRNSCKRRNPHNMAKIEMPYTTSEEEEKGESMRDPPNRRRHHNTTRRERSYTTDEELTKRKLRTDSPNGRCHSNKARKETKASHVKTAKLQDFSESSSEENEDGIKEQYEPMLCHP